MADYQLRTVSGLPFVWHHPTMAMIPISNLATSDLGLAVEYRNWLAAGNAPDPEPASIDFSVPQQLSNRQFWTQLALAGHINETAALNAMNEDIPDVIETFILTLPANQQFKARMFFKSAVFNRQEQAAAHTKAAFALTDAQVDQFFRDASLL